MGYLVIILLVMILVPLFLTGSCYLRSKDYGRGFASVAEGQTIWNVTDAMGQPDEIETCYGPVYSNERVVGQCSKTLVYYSFLQKWGVILDKNGTVIAKYHNVSH